MSEFSYLVGDVDSIKDFVLETSALPQIQGGSELLLDCESQIKARYKDQVIYCGGGAFLLKVAAHEAPSIKNSLEQLYYESTLVASVTIAHEGELPPMASDWRPEGLDGWAGRLLRATPPSGGDSFAWRMVRLQARLREAKDERWHAPFYQALPFGQRCTRCGKRMAAYERRELGERLCPVCYLRDEAGRGRRKIIHGVEVRGRFNQEFWSEHGKNVPPGKRQAEDLDHLVEAAPRKYLAYLYADGNEIGRLLHGAQSTGHYEALSTALTQGTKAAVYQAIEGVCLRPLPHAQRWPFHILNVGGDDVVVLLQGGLAWEVAIRFLESFEREVTRLAKNTLTKAGLAWPEGWPDPITASCAVVVADVKHPVRYLERRAGALIKEAKQVARETGMSALTFLWLPTPVVSESGRPLVELSGDGEPRRILGRPYTLRQAQELQKAVHEIVRWPRSLRHRWQEALHRGVLYSTAIIAYDIARRGERVATAATIERLANLFATKGGATALSPPVWVAVHDPDTGGDLWKTALFDALQLAELEAMRPGSQEESGE